MIFRTPLTYTDSRVWGHGAVEVSSRLKGWLCPQCGKAARFVRNNSVFIYADGDEACAKCAKAALEQHLEDLGPTDADVDEWCSRFAPIPPTSLAGQVSLFADE